MGSRVADGGERERNSVKYNPKVLGGKAEITENQVGQDEDRDFYKVSLIVIRREVIRSALLAHREGTPAPPSVCLLIVMLHF